MFNVNVVRDGAVRPRRTQNGGILAWLLFTLLAFCAVVVLCGIFFAKSIRVHESGNNVQVDTPFGSVHVQHNENGRAETGMPVYPGAKQRHKGSSASVDLSGILGDEGLHIVAGTWETADPIDKVQKYYEDKFPSMSVIQHSDKVEMHSIDGNGKRFISLRRLYQNGGEGTEISLASVGEPKAN